MLLLLEVALVPGVVLGRGVMVEERKVVRSWA